MPNPSEREWYIARGGQSYGPVNSQQLHEMARDGRVQPNDHIWTQGMDSGWQPASAHVTLFTNLPTGSGPPPIPSAPIPPTGTRPTNSPTSMPTPTTPMGTPSRPNLEISAKTRKSGGCLILIAALMGIACVTAYYARFVFGVTF